MARIEATKKSEDEIFKEHLFAYDNIRLLGQQMIDVVKNNDEVVARIQKEIKECKELRLLQEWHEEEMDIRKQ